MASDTGNEAGDRDGAEGASGADRLTAPPDEARTPRLPFPVVGIGASAGGLEAYTEFLQACPADAGMAYVLVQHLPPDRESLVAEILARYTAMPVREVADGQAVERDHVYIIRPGHTLTIQDGRLHLGPELAARGHGRPVDDFFRSLAEEQQQRAVALVFSGMGSNGTAGAQAVKAVGGLVVAQEPDSAKFPAMPRSLIDAHLPDYILRPAEVPEALARYAGQSYAADDGPPTASARDEQALTDVLAVLRTRTRHDFSGYRKPTILRRVRRRMGLGQFATLAEYVRALRQTPAEVTALADDLLIHVTGFFRDPEAWNALREKVLAPLAAERPDGAEVRCWVAACATGEEAYTLAMLLVEAAEAKGKRFDVKVFATDMAERALGSARAGAFPNGIESEVTPERLARFFDKDDSTYRVKKDLRERVIFAPQNILQDPPFSRLDIATCRNLLIYLEPETQRRVLGAMHFGLREGGCLMLGNSESAAPADGDFEPIDKKHRLFRRIGPTRPGALDLGAVAAAIREARPPLPPPVRPVPTAVELVHRTLLDRHTPAAVAVDATGQVVYVHGDTVRYLTVPPGGPTHDVLALANDHVRGAVRTALHKAADAHVPVTVRDGLIDTPAGRVRVEVSATPLGPRSAAPLYLVTFRDLPEPPAADPDPVANGRLDDELHRIRNELQSALEEMQSSNEELKASHEEATSLNEELQSTNEELETSKEEMQSLNEELVTVNAQLTAKMGELETTANDLGSLLTSTDIAVLFLDPRFRIRRFTPAVKDLLDLIPSDVGRPLADLRRKFTDPHLAADAQAVLDKLVPIEREVASDSGRTYLRRVLPYRTQDDRIDGVVVAFVDVTAQRRIDAALRASEEKFRTLFETMDQGYAECEMIRDPAGRAVDWRYLELNPPFERMTGVPVAAARGRTLREVLPGVEAWFVDEYDRIVRAGRPERLENEVAPLGRWYEVHVYPTAGDRFTALYEDITDRKRAEAELREREEHQSFLLRFGDRLRAEPDADAVAAAAVRLLADELDLDRCYAVSMRPAEDRADVTHQFHRPEVPPVPAVLRLSDFPEAYRQVTARTLVQPDAAGDPGLTDGERQSLAAMRFGAVLSSALRRGEGNPVWAVVAVTAGPRRWTAGEVALVEQAAERTWAAVERAGAEAALRASEARLAAAFEALPSGVGFVNNDGALALANREMRRYLTTGVIPSRDPSVVGRWRAWDADGRPVAANDFPGARALRGEAVVPGLEMLYARDDGTEVWTQVSSAPVRDADGGIAGAASVIVDIDERKRAEAARRASEERQAFLLRLSDALRSLDDRLEVQRVAMQLLGEHLHATRTFYFLAEPAGGGDWIHALETEYRRDPGMPGFVGRHSVKEFGLELFAGLEHGRVVRVGDVAAVPGLTAAEVGKYRSVGVAAFVNVPLIKAGAFVAGITAHDAVPRDWTAAEVDLIREVADRTWSAVERARAEAAVRASEERLRAVAANLPYGAAFVVDRDLRYVLAGGRALDPAGLTPSDLEGKSVLEALPPDLAVEHTDNYRRALAGEAFQTEHAAHDRHYVTHGVPLRDAAGTVTAVLAVSYDITARKRAEEALRRAEERLRLALNAARMGIWTLDAVTGTQVRDANLNRLLGLDPLETTQPFEEFLAHVHPADRAAVDAAFAASLAEGRPLNAEFRVVRPDGAVRWLRDQGDVFGDAAAGTWPGRAWT